MKKALLICLLALSACGYRMDGGDPIAVSVPYVNGDFEGELTDALVASLSQTSNFRYAGASGGDWTLNAKVLRSTNDRIGYRYDRTPKKAEELPNVLGIENRKVIFVEVSVINTASGRQILGPQTISASADYDYIDPNVLEDITVFDPEAGLRKTTIGFSMGQLDNVGTAGENAIYPIYRKLAQTVVEGMIASGGWDECE